MIIEGLVGPQALVTGSVARARVCFDGALATQDAHARYQESAQRGTLFYAVNTAAQALSVNSSTYTGLVVQNPINSQKNLVLLEAIFEATIAETGVGAIILGWGNSQTAGVPVVLTTGNSSGPNGVPATLGSGLKSVASVGASCTWSVLGAAAAPTFLRPMMSMQFGTAVGLQQTAYKDEIAGSIIIPPGNQVGFETITTATTGIAYISWDEIPVVQ